VTDNELKFRRLWQDPKFPLRKMVKEFGDGPKRLRLTARDLGLGHKAYFQLGLRGPDLPKGRLGYWPKDMPDFEDDSRTITDRLNRRYIKGEA